MVGKPLKSLISATQDGPISKHKCCKKNHYFRSGQVAPFINKTIRVIIKIKNSIIIIIKGIIIVI